MRTHLTFCILLAEKRVPAFTSHISEQFDLFVTDTQPILQDGERRCALTYAIPWWKGEIWEQVYNFLIKSIAQKEILQVHLPDIVPTVVANRLHSIDCSLLLLLVRDAPDITPHELMERYLGKADMKDGIFDVHAFAIALNNLVQAGFLERKSVRVADLRHRSTSTRVGYALTSSDPSPQSLHDTDG